MMDELQCNVILISGLWRDNQWLVTRQPYRGCTFDSPGLPAIGGYPGERDAWNATPLGVVLSFGMLSNVSRITICGIALS